MYLGKPTLCLRTGDLARAVRFYEALGLSVVNSEGVEGQSVVMRRGNFSIMLMSNFGETSINFRGADAADAASHLAAEGFNLEGEPSRTEDGETAWFTRDPDGHGIFFNTQPPELTPQHQQYLINRLLEGTQQELADLGANDECLSAMRELVQRHGEN